MKSHIPADDRQQHDEWVAGHPDSVISEGCLMSMLVSKSAKDFCGRKTISMDFMK